MTGEYKYKSPFNFTVRTVPVLLCNNIPSLADLSHGTRVFYACSPPPAAVQPREPKESDHGRSFSPKKWSGCAWLDRGQAHAGSGDPVGQLRRL